MLHRQTGSLLQVITLLTLIIGGVAQTLHATCNAGFQSLFNSHNQSPCAVAETLGGVCNAGVFTLPPLTAGQVYVGPSPTTANSCRCSSVFYSMASACAACQNAQWISWSAYAFTNCSSVSVAFFPGTIPPGTSVPHYAYQNVTVTDTWNLVQAESDHGAESTAAPTATSRTNPTNTSKPASKSGGTNVGAIAGGVVGGVVGLALIVGLAVFFLRRGQKNQPMPTNLDLTSESPATEKDRTTMAGTPFTPPPPAVSPRLYDPADPSTFPIPQPYDASQMGYQTPYQTPPPPQMYPQPGHSPAPVNSPQPTLVSQHPGSYPGVAEV